MGYVQDPQLLLRSSRSPLSKHKISPQAAVGSSQPTTTRIARAHLRLLPYPSFPRSVPGLMSIHHVSNRTTICEFGMASTPRLESHLTILRRNRLSPTWLKTQTSHAPYLNASQLFTLYPFTIGVPSLRSSWDRRRLHSPL